MKYIITLFVILVVIFSVYMLNNNAKAASLDLIHPHTTSNMIVNQQ